MSRALLFRPSSALLSACVLLAATAPASAFDSNLPYPSEVALADEAGKGFVYRRFPGSARLYTYDLDTPTRSACNEECAGKRRPVLVRTPGAKPMGDWTIVKRTDGYNQWAYKGRPVYTLFHDTPEGDGEGGSWHLLPYEK